MKKLHLRCFNVLVLFLFLLTLSPGSPAPAAIQPQEPQGNSPALAPAEAGRAPTLEQLRRRRKPIAASADEQPQNTPETASAGAAPSPAASSWDWGDPVLSESREWTVMVYLDADNNLEEAGMRDFMEMEQGFADGGPIDVIVLADRAKGFYTGLGDWTGTRAYRVRHNEDPDAVGSELIADLGELNMGDGGTLAAFMAAAVRKYPSKKAALVLWNHGMGWPGMASDDDAGGDAGASALSLAGLAEALKSAVSPLPGAKLDLIQFDMCLMGQAEVIAACAPYAKYMVAGAPVIPAVGMDYRTYLPLFAAKRETADIAAEAVRAGCQGFLDSGARNSSLSAYDLSQAGQFIGSCRKFADKLVPLAGKYWTELTRTLYYSHNYAGMHDYRRGESAVASVDLPGWLGRLKNQPCGEEMRREIAELERAAAILMITTETGPALPNCKGLSFYAPLRAENYRKNYEETAFDSSVGWSRVLKALYASQKKDGMQAPKVTKVEFGSPVKKPGVKTPKGGADFTIKPAKEVMPLSGGDLRGSYIKITLEGKNILWAYVQFGVADSREGDYVLYHQQLLFDEAISETSETTELNTPVFKNGRNELLYQYSGLLTLFFNGTESTLVAVDYTDLSNLKTFTVEGVYSDPTTGGEIPVEVLVDARFNVIVGVTSTQQAAQGTTVRQITPRPDGTFSPTLRTLKSGKSEIETIQGRAIQWKDGPRVVNETIPKEKFAVALGMAESLGGIGGKLMGKPVKTTDNPQIAPFKENAGKSGFKELIGRFASVNAIPLRSGKGYVMAPNGGVVEYARDKDDKGEDIITASIQTYSKGSLKTRFVLEPVGLPVFRMVVRNDDGENIPIKTDYAVLAQDGQKSFWRLFDAGDGSITHLLPLNESWFPKDDLTGAWKGDDGSCIGFRKDPSLQALYAPDENEENLFLGQCKVQDNTLTITNAEGAKMTLFICRSGDTLVVTFADSESCVVYTPAGTGGAGTPAPAPAPAPTPAPPQIPQPLPQQGQFFQGVWGAYANGNQWLFRFAGNRYESWLNGQMMEYGTYSLSGNVFSGVTNRGAQFRNLFQYADVQRRQLLIQFGDSGATYLFTRLQ